MIASSGTVLANLAYLIGAVVLAVVGGVIVWLRHRQPRSVDANMASFKRGLNALAPDSGPAATRIQRADHVRARPTPGLTHVKIDSSGPREPGIGSASSNEDRLEEVAAERAGGQAG